jgi:hypothetical protein
MKTVSPRLMSFLYALISDPKYAPYIQHRKPLDGPRPAGCHRHDGLRHLYLEDMVHARLKVDLVLKAPLKRQDLIKHAVLADQLPVGGVPAARQGTNFNVHPTAAVLLKELAAARG